MKRIIIFTTGQPTTNPRMLKAYAALKSAGYQVQVRYSFWAHWAYELDRQWFERNPENKADFIEIGGNPINRKCVYWLTRLFYKGFSVLPFAWMYAFRAGRTAFPLWLSARYGKADLYMAHNLGALPAAAHASKTKGVPFAFDMEDYHPGETLDATESQRRVVLLQKLLVNAAFVTCASPGIQKALSSILPKGGGSIETINNVFPQTEFIPPAPVSGKLKLVWFSQTISFRRGLEPLIEIARNFSDSLELHFIGDISDDFNSAWVIPNNHFIYIHAPMPPLQLHSALSVYDIGLALEQSNIEPNRDICLTNKIWAYLQAGLFILASDTSAQRAFVERFQQHGYLLNDDPSGVKQILESLIRQKEEIRQNAFSRQKAAAAYSWEKERLKLEHLVKKVLYSN